MEGPACSRAIAVGRAARARHGVAGHVGTSSGAALGPYSRREVVERRTRRRVAGPRRARVTRGITTGFVRGRIAIVGVDRRIERIGEAIGAAGLEVFADRETRVGGRTLVLGRRRCDLVVVVVVVVVLVVLELVSALDVEGAPPLDEGSPLVPALLADAPLSESPPSGTR